MIQSPHIPRLAAPSSLSLPDTTMPPSLAETYDQLRSYAELSEMVTLQDIDYFQRLARHFIDEIKLHTPVNRPDPPFRLPAYIHTLFKNCLKLDDVLVIQLWSAFKLDIWSSECSTFRGLSQQETFDVDSFGLRFMHRSNEQLGMTSTLIQLLSIKSGCSIGYVLPSTDRLYDMWYSF